MLGLFNDGMVVREVTRRVYPESRFVGCNYLDGRLMVVVFCIPADNPAHIISFRKANSREQKNSTAKRSDRVDWSAVDALPLADSPDDDSPELTVAEFAELRPLSELLPSLGVGKQRITLMFDESVSRSM